MSDYIPEEIQLRIFHLLPVKSLLRFRCVCKSWRETIDSHSFAQSHLALQKPGFLAQFEDPELLALDPLGLPDPSKNPLQYTDPMRYFFSPIGTLHGIIYLVIDEDVEVGIQLWNPSIRKVVSIPGPRDHWYKENKRTTTYTSFWIDPSTKHFKIFVAIFGQSDAGECYLYSSVRRDWKDLHQPEVDYQIPDDESPALVIGEVAYWIALHNEYKMNEYIDDPSDEWIFDDEPYTSVVWAFDFVREEFDTIEAPLAKANLTMCNWQDSLSLLHWDGENRYNLYSRQGGSWVNVLRVSLPTESSHLSCVFRVEEDHRGRATVSRDPALCNVGADHYPMKYTSTIIRRQYECSPFVVYGYVESLLFP